MCTGVVEFSEKVTIHEEEKKKERMKKRDFKFPGSRSF